MGRAAIISVDGHVKAPRATYRDYMDPAYLDRFDEWLASMEGQGDGFVRPDFEAGQWDAQKRLTDLATQGVAAEVLFPNGTAFAVGRLDHAPDPGETQAANRAYNRWIVDLSAQAPGRLLGQALVSFADVDAAVEDVHWAKEHGLVGIVMPPLYPGSTFFFDPVLDPIWAACQETGLSLSQHGGSGAPDYGPIGFASLMVLATEHSWFSGRSLWQLILGGVFDRFPDLKLCFVETEVWWMAPMIEQLDKRLAMGDEWTDFADFMRAMGGLERKPSEYWRLNCYAGISPFHPAQLPVDDLGSLHTPDDGRFHLDSSNAMFGVDYPHFESIYPGTLDQVAVLVGNPYVTEDDARRILYGNAAEAYGVDLDALQPAIDAVGFELDEAGFPSVSDRVERVTGGSRPNPFGLPPFDLGEHGYVADELTFGGDATAYRPADGAELGDDGRWALVPDRTAPFRTRLLVLRPREAGAFSGTVWLSWMNVTAGFEIGDFTREHVKDGDATVYVSAQRIGHEGVPGAEGNGLRNWDPERYGELEHPGDDFSYDLFTQAARLVGKDRDGLPVDPLAGFPVERVLGTGTSQSAVRLTSYLNGVQPFAGALDGALLVANFGQSALVVTPEDFDGSVQASFLRKTRIRDDLDIPVLLLTTETEAESLEPVRQPDTVRFRTWEIAGAAHVGAPRNMGDIGGLFVRDGLALPESATGSTSGAVAQVSRPSAVDWLPVLCTARAALPRWAALETLPPSFPLIQFDDGAIVRDEHGNAQGGIRMPELEVPLATHRGTVEGADVMASLFGSMTPLPADDIRARYPSREAVLAALDEAADRGVEAGWFLARDVDTVKANAHADAEELLPEW